MSDPIVLAALIASIPVLLGMFGRAAWTISTTILAAYKSQAEATITAKDRDLAAKDREIARLRDGVQDRLDRIEDQLNRIEQAR